MRPTSTQAHLRKRYTKVVAMQAADPVRFLPDRRGAKFQIRDERYHQVLRHLRMRMPETWDPDVAHQVHVEERIGSVVEHINRTGGVVAGALPLLYGGAEKIAAKLAPPTPAPVNGHTNVPASGRRRSRLMDTVGFRGRHH